jgi:hypothetical protein
MTLVAILHVPCLQAVLPMPMHTLNTTKHFRPTSCLIRHHQPHRIFFIGSSKILWPKDIDHNLAELAHRLDGCIFTNMKVLNGIVRQNSIASALITADISWCALNPSNCIPLTLKIATFLLACVDDLHGIHYYRIAYSRKSISDGQDKAWH